MKRHTTHGGHSIAVGISLPYVASTCHCDHCKRLAKLVAAFYDIREPQWSQSDSQSSKGTLTRRSIPSGEHDHTQQTFAFTP